MFLIAGFLAAYGQDLLLIEGTVVDGSNRPLENVSIGIEGSAELPVVSDSNGKFTMSSESAEIWLNISPSSGYKTKRIYLNGRTEVKMYLAAEDLDAGDDIIPILRQQGLRRDQVAAFNTLNSEGIIETPDLTVDQYMQGRVSGMYVVYRSGHPAAGASSFIRGVNSLNAKNQPLYIVDGIPLISKGVFNSVIEGFEYNPLLGVNTMDISKTTVIKDATVTAAFGSQASNGLVLIETLDPSATQTIIEIDFRTGYSLSPDKLIPQLDGQQHKTLISEVLFSSGLEEELVREQYPNLFLQPGDEGYVNYQHNTNWQELIFTDASFNNLNVSVKGGDEIARYGLSFGYINGGGVIEGTKYEGYNLRFVGKLNIFPWLKGNSGVALNYNNSSLIESAKVPETSPILTALAKSPMLNPYQYDDKDQELGILAEVDELGVSNPQAVIEGFEATNTNFNSTFTFGLDFLIRENITLNTNFGINYNLLNEQMFMPNHGMELYYNDEAINVAKASNNSLRTIYNNTSFNYKKDFGKHSITSNSGFNIQNNTYEFDWGLTKNAPENDEFRFLQSGTANLRAIGGNNRTWNWLSLYERFTYSYMDRYMLQATVSLDGSSRIGNNAANTVKIGGTPFGIFYSAGAAWRLSNTSLFRNMTALEDLKIRLTYGRTGNDDVGESNALKYYQAIKFRETTGLFPASSYNDELTYETITQLNAGIDLALWGNRLTTSFDIYQSNTDNMLIYTPLDAYFGYSYRPENGGKMKNAGFDVNLFIRILNLRAFKWDVQAAYSVVQNEVTEINGDKLVTEVTGAEIINIPGEEANSFYGYIFEGVYADAEAAAARGLLNNKFLPYQAGDAIFKDISGPDGTPDGIINNFDKTVIGSSIPSQWGGVSNTFTFKRWALYAFVQFVYGNELFNYVRFKNESMTGLENQSKKVLDRWQYQGQETEVPRALYNDLIGNSAFSTRWIEDGSYVRLKNVSLSYTIPDEFLIFKNAKFYISATNILVWSKYLGYDPEFSYSSMHITQGIDYGLIPPPRQFVLGIKFGL
ncbi:SusC/RagA family TonB-linked outer membrane protein [Bacteroidota bacterium]